MALHVRDHWLRWALLSVLVLSVAVGVWRYQDSLRNGPNFHMGTVVRLNNDGTYQVQIRGGLEFPVLVATTTPVFEGVREDGRNLQTGQRVMVEGAFTDGGVLVADSVRILRSNR